MIIEEYRNKIYNPVIEQETKGFLIKKLSSYKEDCYKVKISKGLEYRPDLIAETYLHSSSYAWLITYVNEFQNGIRDYYFGRTIKIPNL